MWLANAGALALGAVLGYVTHYLVRRDENPGVHDLAAIVAVLLGGLVLDAVGGAERTGAYFLGLGAGFFLYWLALLAGREPSGPVMGSRQAEPPPDGTVARRSRVRLFPFSKR